MSWPGFVPVVESYLTPPNALAALANAHESVVGGEIPAELLFATGAQSALETNRWGADPKKPHGFKNLNFGNVRGNYLGTWTSFAAGEVFNGKETTLPPGPENKFRAYLTADDGARDYLALLARKWPKAIEAGNHGDLKGFVQALHEGGYFTANPDLYLRAETTCESYLEKLPSLAVWVKGLHT